MKVTASEPAPPSPGECLLAGLVFGLVGTAGLLLIFGGLIVFIRSDTSFRDYLRELDPTIVTCACLAASITGASAWRRIVPKDSGPRRGALAGLVVGVAAHPVFWGLTCLFGAATDPNRAGIFLAGIPFAFMFGCFSSLGMAGWVTAPLGGFLGALVVVVKSLLVGWNRRDRILR